jgi:hypothetical protein
MHIQDATTSGKQFFFEKKNQKTFICFERRVFVSAAPTKRTKVFCFFFQKRKYFLASPGSIQAALLIVSDIAAAATAHREHEQQSGTHDENWPDW